MRKMTAVNDQTNLARAYFDTLFDAARALIARFPLTTEPPTMDFIATTLEPVADKERAKRPFANPGKDVAREREQAGAFAGGNRAVGLNTVGMLLDRLSILAIKSWNLEHRAKAAQKAKELRDTQVAELIEALAAS